MALTITDRAIRSPHTSRFAWLTEDGSWRVDWLYGQVLTFEQAEAAMNIADTIEQMTLDAVEAIVSRCSTDKAALDNIKAWADQLGKKPDVAVPWASDRPLFIGPPGPEAGEDPDCE
jgi:hypothetical protein